MGIKSWYISQTEIVKAAVVTGVLTLVGGIFAGAFALASTEINKPSPQPASEPAIVDTGSSRTSSPTTKPPTSSAPPSTIASVTPTIKASPECLRQLRITAPADGFMIANGKQGVVIHGTACALGADSGWLFDFDPSDGYYYDDFSGAAPTAVVQSSATRNWHFSDSPIGDPGDLGKRYTITLVLANPACGRFLRSAPQIDGDYKVRKFPAVCTVVQKVDVYVTYAQD